MLDKEDIEVKTIKKLFTFFDNYMKEEIHGFFKWCC